MFNASTAITNNSTKDSTQRFTLPVFNKSSRSRSNLAANLATAGLFSALAACGGSSDSSTDNKTTAIDFDTFTQAAAYADGIRYAASDADSSTFYIREGLTGGAVLGALPVTVDGKEAITYSITGDTASYFSFDQSSGELKLKAGMPLDFANADAAAIDDRSLTITIEAKSGSLADTHTATIQLGEHYSATNAGGTFYASAGDDLLVGGTGNDVLFAGAGNDTFTGGAGADQFWFGKHATSATDTNHDTITDFARTDQDMIIIKTGLAITSTNFVWTMDKLTVTNDGTANTKITFKDPAWANNSITVNGQHPGDDAAAEWAKDIWFHQSASGGRKTLYGGENQDYIEGGTGDDTIYGNAGNDIIYGGAGNDEIWGGGGNDIIYGGSGSDQFRYYGTSINGNDTIKNFSRTDKDKIVIEFFKGVSFEAMPKSYNAGNAIITGYSTTGGTITLAATDEITWHATDKPLMSSDFGIHAEYKPPDPLYSDDIAPLDDIA